MNKFDQALDQLSAEFSRVSPRIVRTVLVSYLKRSKTVDQAVRSSRARIRDACLT